jgi:hypothetical protein
VTTEPGNETISRSTFVTVLGYDEKGSTKVRFSGLLIRESQ